MRITKLRFYIITFVCLFIIINTVRSLGDLYKAQGRLVETKRELAEAQANQKKLLAQKNWVESDKFVEEQARNKLGMGRPGETVIILPESLQQSTGRAAVTEEANWKKWVALLK